MSMHPQEPPSVPEETRQVARAAFPKGPLCLHIADELGAIYNDSQFVTLFPCRGKPAEAPGRLALATVLQFVEGLSDRQAADAVRGRIDWKYALGLSLRLPAGNRGGTRRVPISRRVGLSSPASQCVRCRWMWRGANRRRPDLRISDWSGMRIST